MNLFRRLFEKPTALPSHPSNSKPVFSEDVIEGLQAGRIGSIVLVYLFCHDLRHRDTKAIGEALTSAYDRMMDICPGLRTETAKIYVDESGENNHWISLSIRFVNPSEAPQYQAKCVRILAEHGFE